MEQNSKYIRLAADLQSDSIVDGPGLRAVIWTQGCPHHCPFCQNPQTWDPDGGGEVEIKDVLEAIDELEGQTGITFSGGDPMFQPHACYEIAKYCKDKGYDIWVYTGYTYEELLKLNEKDPIYKKFLSVIDVLVDGRFINEEKNLNLLFRGSNNQRLIDMPKTLKTKKVQLIDEDEYFGNNKFKKPTMYV